MKEGHFHLVPATLLVVLWQRTGTYLVSKYAELDFDLSCIEKLIDKTPLEAAKGEIEFPSWRGKKLVSTTFCPSTEGYVLSRSFCINLLLLRDTCGTA